MWEACYIIYHHISSHHSDPSQPLSRNKRSIYWTTESRSKAVFKIRHHHTQRGQSMIARDNIYFIMSSHNKIVYFVQKESVPFRVEEKKCSVCNMLKVRWRWGWRITIMTQCTTKKPQQTLTVSCITSWTEEGNLSACSLSTCSDWRTRGTDRNKKKNMPLLHSKAILPKLQSHMGLVCSASNAHF